MMTTRIILNASVLVFLSACLGSIANAATISSIPPKKPIEIFGSASFVFLEGEIDAETPKQLEQYIIDHNVDQYSVLFLDSPGGTLLAGMEIGRVIRKYGLSTNVGQLPPNGDLGDIKPGVCFSSCSLAFLGGRFRYLRTGSKYGVHRFYSEQNSATDMDVAQIVSASLVNYLREMGIDTAFFELMTKVGGNDLYEPTGPEMTQLKIINNGLGKPVWTIESNAGALYLKGERDTIYGLNKFIVLCSNRKMALYIVFDPQGREQEATTFGTHSLMIDGEDISVTPVMKTIQNHLFNGIYKLTRAQWKRLRSAKTVGLMVRAAQDAPVFLGFDAMPFEDGSAKFGGLQNNCR